MICKWCGKRIHAGLIHTGSYYCSSECNIEDLEAENAKLKEAVSDMELELEEQAKYVVRR